MKCFLDCFQQCTPGGFVGKQPLNPPARASVVQRLKERYGGADEPEPTGVHENIGAEMDTSSKPAIPPAAPPQANDSPSATGAMSETLLPVVAGTPLGQHDTPETAAAHVSAGTPAPLVAPAAACAAPASPPAATPPSKTAGAAAPAPLVLVDPRHASRPTLPDTKSAAWTAARDALDKTLKAFQPLDLRRLPDEIQRALAYIRAKGGESRITPSAEMGHDVRILRFLIGQKWDVKAAGQHHTRARTLSAHLRTPPRPPNTVPQPSGSLCISQAKSTPARSRSGSSSA